MEFKKKTIIWEDNNEPPKDYIWAKKDGKFYEYSYATRSWIESKSISGGNSGESGGGEGGSGDDSGGSDENIGIKLEDFVEERNYSYKSKDNVDREKEYDINDMVKGQCIINLIESYFNQHNNINFANQELFSYNNSLEINVYEKDYAVEMLGYLPENSNGDYGKINVSRSYYKDNNNNIDYYDTITISTQNMLGWSASWGYVTFTRNSYENKFKITGIAGE